MGAPTFAVPALLLCPRILLLLLAAATLLGLPWWESSHKGTAMGQGQMWEWKRSRDGTGTRTRMGQGQESDRDKNGTDRDGDRAVPLPLTGLQLLLICLHLLLFLRLLLGLGRWEQPVVDYGVGMVVRGWDAPGDPSEPPGSRGWGWGSLTVIVVGSLPALLVVALGHGAGQRCGGLLWCGWGWAKGLGCLWGPLCPCRVSVSLRCLHATVRPPLTTGGPHIPEGFPLSP